MNIHEIIADEIQKLIKEEQWNDNEESLSDKIYARRFGIETPAIKSPNTNSVYNANGEFMGQGKRENGMPYSVYRNPQSLSDFPKDARGILLPDGTLYLSDNNEIGHYNLIDFLASKHIIPNGNRMHYHVNYPEEFVAVIRNGTRNELVQSVAYEEFPYYYEEMFDNANKKYPFKFLVYSYQ